MRVARRIRDGCRAGRFGAVDARGSSAGACRSIIPNVSGFYKVGAAVSSVRVK
ncbi:hypothetical protein C7S16_4795 [Burkholderia thailandensis]|uniref:Uncharacterized protein n=1 Tax=Burkholderia thailandensis TaxID=57975 RepID=A0AAW9CMD1_BURTH|nr:hypothetical protein [Burkholderia thailandensis]